MKKLLALSLAIAMLLCACASDSGSIQPATVYSAADQSEASDAYSSMQSYFGWNGDYADLGTLPDNYGGAYIGDDNILTVCLVEPTEDDTALIQTACGTDRIIIRPVAYTLAYLSEAAEYLGQYNADSQQLCYAWGVDEQANNISIVVQQEMADEAEAVHSKYPCIEYTVEESLLTLADHSLKRETRDVVLTSEYGEYSADTESIYFYVQNNSCSTVFFTHSLYFEIEQDGQWYSIPYRSDISFTMELPSISAGETLAIGEQTANRCFDFSDGHYRVGFVYALDNYDPNNGQDFDHVAWAEFDMSSKYEAPDFCNITQQSTDPVEAADQGCIVIDGDKTQNLDLAADFFDKALVGMPCQMRVVDESQNTVRDVSYRPSDGYTIQVLDGQLYTYHYAYACVLHGEKRDLIVFSVFSDLEKHLSQNLLTLDIDVHPLLSSYDKVDISVLDSTVAKLDEAVSQQAEKSSNTMLVKSFDNRYSMSISQYDYDDEVEISIAVNGPGFGKVIDSYTHEGDCPIYIFPMYGSEFGVVYQLSFGDTEIRVYDADADAFTATYVGEHYEIINQLCNSFKVTQSTENQLTAVPLMYIQLNGVRYPSAVTSFTMTYTDETGTYSYFGDSVSELEESTSRLSCVGKGVTFGFAPSVQAASIKVMYSNADSANSSVAKLDITNGEITVPASGRVCASASFEGGVIRQPGYYKITAEYVFLIGN